MTYAPFIEHGTLNTTYGQRIYRQTTPSSAILTSIILLNQNSTAATVELVADGRELLMAHVLQPYETEIIDLRLPLDASVAHFDIDAWTDIGYVNFFLSGVILS